MLLRPGPVLALKPMFITDGHDECRHGPDGWTLRTIDGSRARGASRRHH
ncbi:hypothetical protein [Streptomyces sp. NPDC058632]